MAPTDCCEDAGATCASSMISSVTESARLLPTTRSPLHHGTDPDLSAAVPLPSGVAAKGLDLSPVMGPATAGSMTTIAKRKLRGSPARGGGGGGSPVSPMQARLSRGFPPSGVRPSEHQQAKRVAAAAAAGTSSSSPRSGCITSKEQVGTSFSEGEAPPSSALAAAAAAAAAQQACRAAATEKEDAGSVSGMSISAEEGGEAEQEDGPPALESLGSAPAPPTASSKGALKAQQQKEHGKRKPVDINDMMHKARKAADNIRLLLHAKRCEGGACQVPGCESARQLVEHMRGCHLARGAGCTPKCVQAQKMLRHYADCNRKRALGGRYCLVCSLVARSAASTNHQHTNSNVMAPSLSGGGPPSGAATVSRQPLGYLGPGTVPRRGPSVPQHQGKAAKGVAVGDGDAGRAAAGGALLSSPVGISRVRRSGGGGGAPAQRMQLQQLHGAVHHQQRMGMMPKDGKFFRPLPRTRRGSWGGYDRTRYRRTRFDSIPEEVPEEDCEDDYDEDTTSDAGSKSTAGDSSSSGTGDRAKTLLSSISL